MGPHARIWAVEPVGFLTALGLSFALMLVGAWDVRLLLSQWNTGVDYPVQPTKTKEKGTKEPAIQNAHVGFTVTGIDDIGKHVVSNFSLLGYRVISERPGEWVFQRGKKSAALWETDLHLLFTTLTVRSGPQPGGGCWVTCGWDITTWGMAYLTRKDIAKLKAEGRELETLLQRDSSPGPKTEIANEAEKNDDDQLTMTPSPPGINRLVNSDVDSQQAITPARSHAPSTSSVDITNFDLEMLRMQVRGPARGLMLTEILAILFWIGWGTLAILIDYVQLKEAILDACDARALWMYDGGEGGSIEWIDTVGIHGLVIRQTMHVHHEIEVVLEGIGRMRSKEPAIFKNFKVKTISRHPGGGYF
jgi:hypothetical protein